MPNPHEVFKALGPVDWESFAQEDTTGVVTDIFSNARSLVDSVPGQDDSRPIQPTAEELRKEWKEVKINPRDNPLGLHLYKLPAKDGRGAWFARRSVHDGQRFRKWKTGMEREFDESLKVQGQPGDGKIRGLGADKRVVDQTIDGCGKIQVYQLSAQFPGPTSPRDFVTLCLSSDAPITAPAPDESSSSRSYMLVSKPCDHPECPERQGFIRGYYESVELIRAIKAEKPLHSPASSASLSSKGPTPSATTSSSKLGAKPFLSSNGESTSADSDSHGSDESTIEWIMITRSDPGGSVPRFLIEKKTPEGIATDANKFVQWVSSDEFETLLDSNFVSAPAEAGATASVAQDSIASSNLPKSTSDAPVESSSEQHSSEPARSPGPGGVYGMISGALGIVASAAASRFLGPSEEGESESDISTSDASDASSSIHSFHSFGVKDTEPSAETVDDATSVITGADGNSINSARSSHKDREFMKKEERKRKAEEKLRRAEERALAKKSNDAQRDELALQKLREKYERGIAKQEEKYQRERRKLEAKRAAEERKVEERRRKQLEREDKASLMLELDKTRAERDVARKEVESLQEQIKQQQALNTKLVARLSREGIIVDDSSAPSSGSGGGLSASSLSPSIIE